MFVFLTKLNDIPTAVTYRIETDIIRDPEIKDGVRTGGTHRVYGTCIFNKETQTFAWQPETDPYFLGVHQEIKRAITKKLQEIVQQRQEFPEAFSIRE